MLMSLYHAGKERGNKRSQRQTNPKKETFSYLATGVGVTTLLGCLSRLCVPYFRGSSPKLELRRQQGASKFQSSYCSKDRILAWRHIRNRQKGYTCYIQCITINCPMGTVPSLFAKILLGHLETRCSNSILDTCDTYYGEDADERGAGRKIRVANARGD